MDTDDLELCRFIVPTIYNRSYYNLRQKIQDCI